MTTVELTVSGLFDRFAAEQKDLEVEINSLSYDQALNDGSYYQRLNDLSHCQAMEMTSLAKNYSPSVVASHLHHHPFHQKYLLQSAFVKHALEKPYGYAGDKDLMLMICSKQDYGNTAYAILKNRVYLSLPGSEAVRQRVKSMYRLFQDIPEGGHVLNLACGPALEVQQFINNFPERSIKFDLVDHDIRTVRYTQSAIESKNVCHALGNALRIIKGNFRIAIPRFNAPEFYNPPADFQGVRSLLSPLKYQFKELQPEHYDLVYANGLYDYIKDFPNQMDKGTTGLTRQLFKLVKPGGMLIIGNFLTPSKVNPHKEHHITMMEIYAQWYLFYRSLEDIYSFTAGVPEEQFSATLTDEFLDINQSNIHGAIGFLIMTKKI